MLNSTIKLLLLHRAIEKQNWGEKIVGSNPQQIIQRFNDRKHRKTTPSTLCFKQNSIEFFAHSFFFICARSPYKPKCKWCLLLKWSVCCCCFFLIFFLFILRRHSVWMCLITILMGAMRVTLNILFLFFFSFLSYVGERCVSFSFVLFELCWFFCVRRRTCSAWWCLRCCCRISSDYPHIYRAISIQTLLHGYTVIQKVYAMSDVMSEIQDKCKIHAQPATNTHVKPLNCA